ncbi:HAD-IC family P-type ATPase [Alkalibaculum sp. M08DMB]|uniref:HAD-IC family P-type ATPase n=2 Tax=Alkalibaculum sporogenes TaxID=2655001 RepID=A0A6A7K690_9FIRM|nr:HAD-IC family P-type ATPase [Alkalibaculum sporogenes]
MSIDEIVRHTNSNLDSGLSSEEAQKRLSEFGANIIESGEKISVLKILFDNINNIIVYLLILASVVSFLMGDPIEGFAIIVAVVIAVLSGFISEYKAQKSVESLQNMIKTVSKVKRDSEIIEIESSKLVFGDLIFIETGDSITADARIIESKNFASIESALTGEAEAVEKEHDFLAEDDTTIGDRKNMVYTGTAATRGNAYAIITATGMDTEIGKISDMLNNNEKSSTPLEIQLDRLGKALIIFAAFVALVVSIVGILSGDEIYSVIKIGVILAIAAIPEALPAVSTITLAVGMKTMSTHNALVKSLSAVETLGSTTVICTDKTGTLTENQMTVKVVYTSDKKQYEIEGLGYVPKGDISEDGNVIEPKSESSLNSLIIAGVLCSNATIVNENNEYRVIGDPTEGGLIVLGKKASIEKSILEKNGYKRIGEIPFSSKEKFMATAYMHEDGTKTMYLKGAPDVLIDLANFDNDKIKELTGVNESFAEKGMRVLAIAEIKGYDGNGSEESMRIHMTKGIDLLGFTGIIDPPREDVKQAIKETQDAGIRVIMITGDHPKTARIIADKVGISNATKVITGKEMDNMSVDQLAKEIMTTSIFARVSPENKLQIVKALNIDNQVTAMTGDGVNDAPALNGADIGIAMGIRGTEVAKDASDMILTDDKFSTIVDAVKEGRVIFENIEKFVYFLFSCNVVEILAVLLTIIFRLPMPILALQILWLNLVVDILPAMSLAWEPGESDIMQRKPRDPKASIVNKKFLLKIAGNGILISLGSLAVFVYGISQGYSIEICRTMTFSTMAFGQLFHIFNVRHKNSFGIDKSLLRNPYLIGALVSSVLLQLIVVYVPFFNTVIGTMPLDSYKWFIIVLGSLIPTVLVQSYRLIPTKAKTQ